MDQFSFQVSVETDRRTGRILAVYFRVREGKSARTREVAGGNVLADYGSGGKLLGVELLAPCEVTILDEIAGHEPAPIREFIRQSTPLAMVVA